MATTLLATTVKSAAGSRSGARAVNRLPQIRINVSSDERWLSLAAGGALVALGVTGRTPLLLSSLLGAGLIYRAASGNCPSYQALGVSTSDSTAKNSVIAAGHGTWSIEHAITVNKPAAELYRFWRDFENLPRFMTHLLDVDTTTDGRSHWIARGPLGLKVEWDAEIVTDAPNNVIAWKSLDGADVDTTGSVDFTELPNGRGTEVRVVLKYDPPAGKLGTAIAKLVGKSPEAQIKADMRRFKQVLETGETATICGQPHGRRYLEVQILAKTSESISLYSHEATQLYSCGQE